MAPMTVCVDWEATGARPLVAVRTAAAPAPRSDESELSARPPAQHERIRTGPHRRPHRPTPHADDQRLTRVT